MKIELDKKQLDEVTSQYIKQLEGEVRSLLRKLDARDKKIQQLQDGADFSESLRKSVLEASLKLVERLEDAGWVEYERYGAHC